MKLLKTLKIWRVNEFSFLYLFILFGFFVSGTGFSEIPGNPTLIKNFILITASFVFLSISLFFAANDYFDFKLDSKVKDTRNPLVTGKMKKGTLLLIMIITGIIGVGITYFINLPIFFLSILTAVSVYLYSGVPFRFKERFVLDIITHSLPGVFMTMIGYLLVANLDMRIVLYSTLGFLFFVATCIAQQIRDYKTDKKHGAKTTVIALGVKNSLHLLKILAIFIYGFAAAILLNMGLVYIPFLVVGLPPVLYVLLLDKDTAISFFGRCFRLVQFTVVMIGFLIIFYMMLGLI